MGHFFSPYAALPPRVPARDLRSPCVQQRREILLSQSGRIPCVAAPLLVTPVSAAVAASTPIRPQTLRGRASARHATAAVLADAAVLASPRCAARPTDSDRPRRARHVQVQLVWPQFDRALSLFQVVSQLRSCAGVAVRSPVLQFVRRFLAWCSSAVLSLRGCGF